MSVAEQILRKLVSEAFMVYNDYGLWDCEEWKILDRSDLTDEEHEFLLRIFKEENS